MGLRPQQAPEPVRGLTREGNVNAEGLSLARARVSGAAVLMGRIDLPDKERDEDRYYQRTATHPSWPERRERAGWVLQTTRMAKSGYAPRKAELARWVIDAAREIEKLERANEQLRRDVAGIGGRRLA